MMNKIILMGLCCILLSSCGSDISSNSVELTTDIFLSQYTNEKRAVDLSSMGLSDFVSLNGLNGDTEIVNLNVSDNAIDVLNITDYPDLLRLVAQNNSFTYFNDIKFPSQIKHINLAHNELESLKTIDNLKFLTSIDISHNLLDEDDFDILMNMENLRLVYADGNNVSQEFLTRLSNFNSRYLQEIQGANPTIY